jgi:nucleoid DNA-binding protein
MVAMMDIHTGGASTIRTLKEAPRAESQRSERLEPSSGSVYIFEEVSTEEELFEGLQRPEVDVSQCKPHGESRYTGKVLRKEDINRPTRNIVESTWMGLAAFVQKQLQQGRSVNIPNFGKFKHVTRNRAAQKSPKKEPVFVFNEQFLKDHGISARSIPRGALDPEEREINYAEVGVFASLPKDTIVSVLRSMFEEIGKLSADTKKQAIKVRIQLYEVGRICCDKGLAKFSFGQKWGATRPGTSDTCRSLASRGSNASRGSVLGDTQRPAATPSALQSGMQAAMSSALAGLDQASAPKVRGSF